MGKGRSYEIIDIRKKIMGMIVDSPVLVKLLGEEHTEDPADTIPFHKSFPHEYIPETITAAERFINFEISARANSRNDVYKNIILYFFVVCHQDVVMFKEKGREYLWYDKATCELDEILSKQDVIGVGKMCLVSNVPYCPQAKFKGRLLTFEMLDYVDGRKYGR